MPPNQVHFIQDFLQHIPGLVGGPGGAVAVVLNGEQIFHHVWGYADMQMRIPMTSSTMMPVCSITKQMLCMLLMDVESNPTPEMDTKNVMMQMEQSLDGMFQEELQGQLKQEHLLNNRSGIRDYWAMSVLWGRHPDGEFSLSDAKKAIDLTRSLQFTPGEQYSYSNLNFHIIARVIENATKRRIQDLFTERIFKPAEMHGAIFCEDNARLPPPCVGYEGLEDWGYLPTLDRIHWSGDGGVVASLDDMIRYEQYLQKTVFVSESLHARVCKKPPFDCSPRASYGYGLFRSTVAGELIFGHGGAIRGFSLYRLLRVATDKVSVVVMLNHEADTQGIAMSVLGHILNKPLSPIMNDVMKQRKPPTVWYGTFFDPDTQLVIQVKRCGTGRGTGRVKLLFANEIEILHLYDEHHARSYVTHAEIADGGLKLIRLVDNCIIHVRRVANHRGLLSEAFSDSPGTYYCAEIESTFRCEGTYNLLYGLFDGFLGQGPPHLMEYLGEDIWYLACPRGPGNWTVVFRRDESGAICGVVIGCWLARKNEYVKLPPERRLEQVSLPFRGCNTGRWH